MRKIDSKNNKNYIYDICPQCKHCQFPNKKICLVLLCLAVEQQGANKAIINLFHAGEPIPEISGVIEDHAADQCCGSGRILTGSGSNFQKRPDSDLDPVPVPDPDPDPDPNKFSANFFLKICLMKICSKKNLHESKSKTIEIPEVSLAFKHTKKVEIWSFIRARIRIWFRIQTFLKVGSESGSSQNLSGSATLVRCVVLNDVGLRCGHVQQVPASS
jgi:hypothetical protein